MVSRQLLRLVRLPIPPTAYSTQSISSSPQRKKRGMRSLGEASFLVTTCFEAPPFFLLRWRGREVRLLRLVAK